MGVLISSFLYANPLICPIGADVRQAAGLGERLPDPTNPGIVMRGGKRTGGVSMVWALTPENDSRPVGY